MTYHKHKDVNPVTTAKLSKWRNSYAVRIPGAIIRRLNLEEGDELQISMTSNNNILLSSALQTQGIQ
ncbi:antidote-toxin recognition antitoxin MazE [Scopulibacillus darangshiensis]|uniref:Antidote-toxin recognition antitoxin MazE n=1 Tax=Scopulibacillus darangshiensis TaxID=442528 RepID=A0A4R2NE06_9BACL|nr:AbrB/MazE/SpoVT family DNA-binding domain-containing protein [Scopulibacillus darangshiensis]TCP19312.1 antidote-toxin recognition antitoxin MazE [Scopulibacillus darangshiensis]